MQIRLYLTSYVKRRRQSVLLEDVSEDEFMMSTPEELFGSHAEFIMSRMYVDQPNWSFLFRYWTTLYDKWVVSFYLLCDNMRDLSYPGNQLLSTRVDQNYWIRMWRRLAVFTIEKDMISDTSMKLSTKTFCFLYNRKLSHCTLSVH